jgi:hypothetical protein
MATQTIDFENLDWSDTSELLRAGPLTIRDIEQNGSVALEGPGGRRIGGRYLRAGPKPWYLTIRGDLSARTSIRTFAFDYEVIGDRPVTLFFENIETEKVFPLTGSGHFTYTPEDPDDLIIAVRLVSLDGSILYLDNIQITD